MLQNQTKPNAIYSIYMYKENLALNNPQSFICHKTQPNQTNVKIIRMIENFCNIFVTWDHSDAFSEVIKLTNHTRLWDAKNAWYSLSATC